MAGADVLAGAGQQVQRHNLALGAKKITRVTRVLDRREDANRYRMVEGTYYMISAYLNDDQTYLRYIKINSFKTNRAQHVLHRALHESEFFVLSNVAPCVRIVLCGDECGEGSKNVQGLKCVDSE